MYRYMLCQQHVIAGGSYINIGNDTFWPHEISCHIEYKKVYGNYTKHARKTINTLGMTCKMLFYFIS